MIHWRPGIGDSCPLEILSRVVDVLGCCVADWFVVAGARILLNQSRCHLWVTVEARLLVRGSLLFIQVMHLVGRRSVFCARST